MKEASPLPYRQLRRLQLWSNESSADDVLIMISELHQLRSIEFINNRNAIRCVAVAQPPGGTTCADLRQQVQEQLQTRSKGDIQCSRAS